MRTTSHRNRARGPLHGGCCPRLSLGCQERPVFQSGRYVLRDCPTSEFNFAGTLFMPTMHATLANNQGTYKADSSAASTVSKILSKKPGTNITGQPVNLESDLGPTRQSGIRPKREQH